MITNCRARLSSKFRFLKTIQSEKKSSKIQENFVLELIEMKQNIE